ncbi:MAG TPA: NAD-dependent epimerase/dehydratase family protein [Solirubrobacteraceae bacterium]|nr:NAD-dependent epimerase/dehydratase family protein [Solirubrobacteraceae bacterium]
MSGAESLSGQRVLVTGGSGFIGRHVVAVLSAAGADVRVVDVKPHPDPAVEIVQGDIADPEVIEAAFAGGVDSIVHLAAVTSVLRSLEHPELTYRTNVAATALLLEGARKAGAGAFAFASTNAVTGPTEAPAITEAATLRPLTPYGSTKAAGEMLMSAYTASYGVRCACLRLTNVYGLGMQAKDSIVARLMRAIRTGGGFEIYGDGRQVRDYVNVSDVVRGFALALLNEAWQGPIVIGAGSSLSVLEVVEAVREITGAPLDVRHGPAKAGEMPAVIVDPSRAHAAGWSPQTSFRDGLAAVWDEWSRADVDAIRAGAAAAPVPAGGAS